MDADPVQNDTMQAPPQGSWSDALRRGWGGLFSGMQSGAIIGGCMCGAAYLLDGVGVEFLKNFFFEGAANPVSAALHLTAAHCLGAGAFEAVCEAHDGLRGENQEHDHIKDAARGLDGELLALEGKPRAVSRAQSYQFDNPVTAPSPAVQAILARGANAPALETGAAARTR